MPEANRSKGFQRGTAGALESSKESTKVLLEGSDIGLGQYFQIFEPLMPDQTILNRVKSAIKQRKAAIFLRRFPPIIKIPNAETSPIRPGPTGKELLTDIIFPEKLDEDIEETLFIEMIIMGMTECIVSMTESLRNGLIVLVRKF